jgi:hypothetical protein
MCFFWRVKNSKIEELSLNSNDSLKSVPVNSDAKQTSSVAAFCALEIFKIHALRHITKVSESIVRWIAILVVYSESRRRASHVEPCKPMDEMRLSIDANAHSSALDYTPSNMANNGVLGGFFEPDEDPSLGIVVKQFAQALCGKIGLSHDALLKLIGQRRVGVDSARPALAL